LAGLPADAVPCGFAGYWCARGTGLERRKDARVARKTQFRPIWSLRNFIRGRRLVVEVVSGPAAAPDANRWLHVAGVILRGLAAAGTCAAGIDPGGSNASWIPARNRWRLLLHLYHSRRGIP